MFPSTTSPPGSTPDSGHAVRFCWTVGLELAEAAHPFDVGPPAYRFSAVACAAAGSMVTPGPMVDETEMLFR